jgi:hypothetical protein
VSLDVVEAKTTPERIEFENLTAAASDVEEAPSEMDEDEWTDRNFGASAVEGSTDSLSDLRYVFTILLHRYVIILLLIYLYKFFLRSQKCHYYSRQ